MTKEVEIIKVPEWTHRAVTRESDFHIRAAAERCRRALTNILWEDSSPMFISRWSLWKKKNYLAHQEVLRQIRRDISDIERRVFFGQQLVIEPKEEKP